MGMIDSDGDIQAAVMTTGAVEVGFTVYADFMNYKKGVYSHKSGLPLGGHAVKIVGWGEDFVGTNQTFYWIVRTLGVRLGVKRATSASKTGTTTKTPQSQ